MKVEKSFIWRLSPSPDDPGIMMAVMGSGAARVVHFRAPGHRVMIGRDGTNVGTPGEMRPVTSTQVCPGIVMGSLNYPKFSRFYKVNSALFGVVQRSHNNPKV